MPLDLKFPQGEHEDCRKLTEITVAHLPADDSLGRSLRISRHSFIWQPGDRADKIYFLKKGRVRLSGVDHDGREIVIAMIGGGEPFGELCFCGGPTELRSTAALATSDCLAVAITIDAFIDYIRQDPEILGKFLFTFCIRLAHAERRIAILALRGVEERLGHSLLHLAQTRGFPLDGRTDEFRLIMTHEELSGLTALSRQRITVVMNQFRRLGLVRYSRTQPLIINTDALTNYLYKSES